MYPNTQLGFLSKGLQFIKNINFTGILDGTSKTLNVVNQAIPIVYQVKPMIQNASTLFKISNAVRSSSSINEIPVQKKEDSSVSPIFYL